MASKKVVRRCNRVYYNIGTYVIWPKTYGPTVKRDYAAAGRSNSYVKTRKNVGYSPARAKSGHDRERVATRKRPI